MRVQAQPSPYSDDHHLYLVLDNGEVIDWGPTLRAHRMFPAKSRSRAHRLATDFATFAATTNQSDWRVWTIHYPSRKTKICGLVADLKRFNSLLNSEFTQLRKYCKFELLLLGIHIEFDTSSGLFDIHAHFVGEFPDDELREEARRRLMTAFSRADVPDDKLRSPYGFAKYASRTFKLARVLRWPHKPLLAAWDLINHSFQFVRTGGSFAEWRNQQRAQVDVHQQQAARKKRENRKATRYQGSAWEQRDRPLVRKVWKIGDENVVGTLFRKASPVAKAASAPSSPSPKNYSSAFVDTTQSLSSYGDGGCTQKLSSASPAEREHSCEFTTAFGLAAFRASIAARVYRCNGVGQLQVTLGRSNQMTAYITRAEVHDAADRVDADGRKPSAKTVREITKRGSFTTIESHLSTWTPQDQRLELPPVPGGLMSTVSALTADLWHMARTVAREEHAAQIAQATADTAEAQAAAAAVGDQADRLAIDLGAALERVTELEKLIAERDQQIEEYANYAHQLVIDTAKKDAEIETLRRTLSEFTAAAAETRKATKPTKAKLDDAA